MKSCNFPENYNTQKKFEYTIQMRLEFLKICLHLREFASFMVTEMSRQRAPVWTSSIYCIVKNYMYHHFELKRNGTISYYCHLVVSQNLGICLISFANSPLANSSVGISNRIDDILAANLFTQIIDGN